MSCLKMRKFCIRLVIEGRAFRVHGSFLFPLLLIFLFLFWSILFAPRSSDSNKYETLSLDSVLGDYQMPIPELDDEYNNYTVGKWRKLFMNIEEDIQERRCVSFRSLPYNLLSDSRRRLIKKEVKFYKSETNFVPKTVFDPSKTVVFWAGLEGTGHHLVEAGLKSICKKDHYPGLCSSFPTYDAIVRCKLQRPALSVESNLVTLEQNVSQYKDRLLFLNCLGGESSKSYPNCRILRRNLTMTSWPDVRQLAEIFERMGFDFRIILLDRSPESILVSTMIKRQLAHSVIDQGQIYKSSIQILFNQLRLLDPQFIAGAVSVERKRLENIKAANMLTRNLGISNVTIREFFSKFRFKRPMCINYSPREDKAKAEKILKDLYRHAQRYRMFFNSFFDL